MDYLNDSMFTCISLYDFYVLGGRPCQPYIFLECSGAALLLFGVRFITLYLSVHTIFAINQPFIMGL
jgi:hypothetical protein